MSTSILWDTGSSGQVAQAFRAMDGALVIRRYYPLFSVDAGAGRLCTVYVVPKDIARCAACVTQSAMVTGRGMLNSRIFARKVAGRVCSAASHNHGVYYMNA